MRRLFGLSLLAALAPLTAPAPAAALDRLCDTRYEDCRAPLLDLINSEPTGGAIDVAFWFMEDDRYRQALVTAKNRGVRVRVLVDPRANETKRLNEQILLAMKSGGLPMRYKVAKSWSDILHWKMMYFATPNVVQFSAANYTPASFVPQQPYWDYIDEVIYFTDDVRLTRSFNTRFEDYWTDQAGNFADYANVSGPQPRYYPISPIDPSLNFTPEQDYAVKATTHYRREYGLPGAAFDVIMYRISDARHPNVMIEAFNQGIPVRLITEQENYRDSRYIWHSYNVDRMWAAGIPIKDRAHQGIVHQKSVILYGQKEVIYGSSNWSTASSNQQLEHNLFSKPCTAGQTTWCDAGNWLFNWFVNQFTSKWSSNEFKPFVPMPAGTPVNKSPANGGLVVESAVTLKWDGGVWAHKYDVHFGTDPNNLPRIATDLMVGSPYEGQVESWQVPQALAPGTTYYWRVVGKTMAEGRRSDEAGLDLAKEGPVWSFTTAGSGGGGTTPYGGSPVALPGTIQAENFDEGGSGAAYIDSTSGNTGGAYRSTDVDIGPTSDGGSGYYVGWTRPGEWLKYTVNVTTAGTYTLEVRIANKGTGARFHVEVDGVDKTGPMNVPNTGDWLGFQTVTKTGIALSAGEHAVRLVLDTGTADNGGVGNFNWLRFSPTAAGDSSPYGGTPAALPGTVQVENFDEGGSGVAYLDSTAGNRGNVYRSTDVDVGPVSDVGGGYYVGWTTPGEWLKYTVNVTQAGSYTLGVRVANKGTGATFRLFVDGVDKTGPIPVPDTGDWQAWQTVTKSGIDLSAGTHVLRLVLDTGTAQNGGVGNFNHLQFTIGSAPSGPTPYGGTPAPVPGTIQAENFDEGSAGQAYSDTTAGNRGSVYRSTDVDIGPASDSGGGFYVGWTQPGEWLRYTVNVTQSRLYTLEVRIANKGTGARFRVEVDGQNVTGSVVVPDTGDWQAWQTVSVPNIALDAGSRVVRLVLETGTSENGGVGNYNWLRFQ